MEAKAECLFVPGKLNPADLGTRGISLDELKSSSWLTGPDFLRKDRKEWPKTPEFGADLTQTIFALVDIGKEVTSTTLQINIVDRAYEIDTALSWNELKLQVAKNLKDSDDLVSIDMRMAEEALIRQEQEICIKPNDVKEFKLKKDENGLYRTHCRFDHADMINAHPIFIPKTSSIAKMIVMDAHDELQHAGVPHTLVKVRETYWIPAGRATVKRCLSKCSACKIWKSKSFELPIMPQLPGSRVKRSKPFENVGVDYCGPFKIKSKNEKAWVILFTCFTTRLIHLEVVETMTAEDFLLSFRNFVGRCGKPKYVLSDNAKQFKTAAKALEEIWKKVVHDSRSLDYFLQNSITWDFITERAPWKGGLYERMVALVKNAMKLSIGKKVLTVHNFRTFLIEAEATVNSRPLTYVHSKEPFVIRPADFIYPAVNLQLPSIANDDIANDPTYIPTAATGGEKLVELYQKNLHCLNKFWQIWSKDYLNLLRERNVMAHKNTRGAIKRKPIVGEIVLVFEPDQPRNHWKIAKIQDVIESSDGEVRTCEIQYMDGFITRRAPNHLYPIEEGATTLDIQCDEEEENVDSSVE
uniref:Integrase catalytic domain-containing protein n=1 Tax=Panagrolaimus sp. ES5 TaxID=591445 RepID=A0AC34FHU9_9BILA